MQFKSSSPSEVEIISSNRLVDSFLKIDQDVIRHRKFNGDMSPPLDRMVISKQNSIGVLLYHRDRQCLLFVKQYRYATRRDNDGWMVEIVAGNIDDGESAEECVSREVREETGYQVERFTPIGQGYSSPGICTEKLYLFYCEVDDHMLVDEGGGLEDEGEDIVVVEWSLAQAAEQLETMQLMDLKTQIALQWFFLSHDSLKKSNINGDRIP